MTNLSTLETAISKATGQRFKTKNQHTVGGGCINQTQVLEGNDGRRFFAKLNQPQLLEMFATEAEGLKAIVARNTIKAPTPIVWGSDAHSAFLVLEYLPLQQASSDAWEQAGRQLAQLHLAPSPHDFGFDRNNYIGATPQMNSWTKSWPDFFAEQRLGFQLELANRKGAGIAQIDQIVTRCAAFLNGRTPVPALLHGDLWTGNISFCNGEAVIYDPAAYYGDPEADIAMTELFGGFGTAFYRGYDNVNPREKGYDQRRDLYNLYHILNHYNLFGGHYLQTAQTLLKSYFG